MSRTGTEILLLVNTGTILEAVACQRDATYTENTAEIDVSCKTSRAKQVIPGRYSTEITLDALYVHNDDGYAALLAAERSGDLILVARMEDGAVYGTGWGVVTSMSKRFPDQAESTISISIVMDEMFDTSTINLVTNPSIEIDTTGWATTLNNTIDRVNTEAEFGSWSLQATYQDVRICASYDITIADEDHTGSVFLWVPTNYNANGIEVTFTGFAAATVTDGVVNMTLRNQWQRVTAYITPDSGDLSGAFVIRPTVADPDAGRFIYIDGAQVEAYPYMTPYCDGDQGPGHAWDGVAHESTSTRD